MKDYGLVCFDVDGTLVDNLEYSWQLFHEHFQTDKHRREDAKNKFFSGKITYLEWANHDIGLWKEVNAKKSDFFEAIEKKNIRLMEGTEDTIKKLKQKGILHSINGVNFRIVNLSLAKVDVNATDTTAIIDEFKDCPFFVNALITSGRHNVSLLFMATDLKRLEGIVNYHLRGNPKVKDIEMNIVISTAKDFVLPLNIDYENKRQTDCDQECKDCI